MIASLPSYNVLTRETIEIMLTSDFYVITVEGEDGAAVDEYTLTLEDQPIRTLGEPCDRRGLLSLCERGLTCMMGEIDGEGTCGALFPAILEEAEPNETRAQAMAVPMPARVGGVAHQNAYDLYTLTLEAETELQVFLNRPNGACHSLWLARIDGDVLDEQGVEAATSQALALSRGRRGRCTQIWETLPAGTYYYYVGMWGHIGPTDYQFNIMPPQPLLEPGDRCDEFEHEN